MTIVIDDSRQETGRYTIGESLEESRNLIAFTIHNAEALTPEQLKADMPRIEAALLKSLARVQGKAQAVAV